MYLAIARLILNRVISTSESTIGETHQGIKKTNISVSATKTTTSETDQGLDKTKIDGMEAVYCQEEGVEGLHQSYIKVHGLCRLPRAHAKESEVIDGKTCNRCHKSRSQEGPEEAPQDCYRYCQKGQYMLVRVPPHCNVKWKNRDKHQKKFRRYHSQNSRIEKSQMVRFIIYSR